MSDSNNSSHTPKDIKNPPTSPLQQCIHVTEVRASCKDNSIFVQHQEPISSAGVKIKTTETFENIDRFLINEHETSSVGGEKIIGREVEFIEPAQYQERNISSISLIKVNESIDREKKENISKRSSYPYQDVIHKRQPTVNKKMIDTASTVFYPTILSPAENGHLKRSHEDSSYACYSLLEGSHLQEKTNHATWKRPDYVLHQNLPYAMYNINTRSRNSECQTNLYPALNYQHLQPDFPNYQKNTRSMKYNFGPMCVPFSSRDHQRLHPLDTCISQEYRSLSHQKQMSNHTMAHPQDISNRVTNIQWRHPYYPRESHQPDVSRFYKLRQESFRYSHPPSISLEKEWSGYKTSDNNNDIRYQSCRPSKDSIPYANPCDNFRPKTNTIETQTSTNSMDDLNHGICLEIPKERSYPKAFRNMPSSFLDTQNLLQQPNNSVYSIIPNSDSFDCYNYHAGASAFSTPIFNRRRRRPCSVTGCSNRVVQGGVCIRHGAKRKICSYPGCTKHVKKSGRCSTHGPPRKPCSVEGCPNVSVQAGRCISHGASKRKCSSESCTKQAVLSGMCKRHHDETTLCKEVTQSKPVAGPLQFDLDVRQM